jgi:PKD repeat protein
VGACAGEGVESHVYQVPGTYTIVLIVIDEEGALSRTTRAITVVP